MQSKCFTLVLLGFCQVIHADLIGAWRFDEASGTVASDAIGTNDGDWVPSFVQDPTWRPTQGQIGGAVELFGQGNHTDYFSLEGFPELNGTPDGMIFAGTSLELTQYAFGETSPRFIQNGNGSVTFEIVVRNDTDNLEWQLQASDDLLNWDLPITNVTRANLEPLGSGYARETFAVPTSEDKIFLRYQVK